jgi:hypothetical protein
MASGVFPLLSSSSSSTTNPEAIIESCEDSFLPQSEGGSIPQEFLDDLNSYLAQYPVAIGDEPITDVKNIDGLCNLINLVETENTEGRQANGEQIRNILNASWPDKSNLPVIDAIIDGLVSLNLIEPSDD